MTTRETVTVEHNGESYTVDKIDPNDPPVDVLEALELGHNIQAAKAVMGEAQWAKYKATRPGAKDLGELVGKLLGTDSGNSDS